jgi:hypothetical protein
MQKRQELFTVSSPWIRNAMLITHTPNAIAMTARFLFQMAMLDTHERVTGKS